MGRTSYLFSLVFLVSLGPSPSRLRLAWSCPRAVTTVSATFFRYPFFLLMGVAISLLDEGLACVPPKARAGGSGATRG